MVESPEVSFSSISVRTELKAARSSGRFLLTAMA